MFKIQSEIPEKNNTATVSVVLCTFNGEKYLREQLDSVVNQTYAIQEIIIQDDGSTDKTLEIAQEYADCFERVVVRSNPSEHGINSNFLSALRNATGDFIAICDQDDIWEPDKIAVQVNEIGDAFMCACDSMPFSEDGSFAHYDSRTPNYGLLRHLFCNEIPGHAMLINRRLMEALPPLEQEKIFKTRMYDFILAITAAAHESIVYVDKVLVHHRRYQTAATFNDYSSNLHSISNAIRILLWTISHYRQLKNLMVERNLVLKDYLGKLSLSSQAYRESTKMIELMNSRRFIDFIRLQGMFVSHRAEIFHTKGKDPSNILRALLFPITSLRYCRVLLNAKDS